MIITLLLSMAFAAEPTVEIKVQPLQHDYPAERLSKKVTAVPAPDSPDSSLPDRAMREKAFAHARLTDTIVEWDELERDLLYMRSKRFTIKELQEKYPKLDQSKLVKLK